MALTTIIAYDIHDDSRRAKVAAILQGLGDRVQRSVFVCTGDEAALTQVREGIRRVIDPDHDSVILWRQCAACWDVMGVEGQSDVSPPALYWAVL